MEGRYLSEGLMSARQPVLTEQDAFVGAIIEAPDDDGARLIFADWLEDNGQDQRAEFIRLQMQAAPADEAERAQRERRERSLLRRYARRWFRPPAGWKCGDQFVVRRGFPESVRVGAQELLDRGAELFARWPITQVRGLNLKDAPDLARKVAALPFLDRVLRLNLDSLHMGREVTGILLGAPAWGNLVELMLRSNDLGDAGTSDLAKMAHLAGVQELDLSHNRISDAGVRTLARSRHRQATTFLSLCGNRGITEPVVGLLQSDNWPSLRTLSLWYTGLGDEGLEALAACPGLAKLSGLILNYNEIGDPGLEALARSEHAANLRTLSLALNRLSSRSVEVLIRSPVLQRLTSLNLYSNRGLRGRSQAVLAEHFGERVSFEKPW
jgi:uncharacterized protein (TIGR02996 family)